jgi:lysozyme
MTNPVVIDISHWNPTPDWKALKAAGTAAVIHKATEGTGNVDGMLYNRAGPAMAAGLKWSTYHFLRPGKLPAQMDHYLRTVNPLEGERMCLDHEDAGVTLGDLEYCVKYLLDKRPDLQITIYSGHLIKEQLSGGRTSSVLAEKTSLWLAQYSTTPSWPTQVWPTWSLWQYTDKATVSGVSQPVDGDRFNGSVEQCIAWFGPADQPIPVPPEPAPPETEVSEVNITTKGSVRVTINGVVYE